MLRYFRLIACGDCQDYEQSRNEYLHVQITLKAR
jgi:hypothetical protein